MKIFNIDNGWSIKLPENWKEEKDEVDGYNIYYPPDSDLTIRIPNFHIFREVEKGWKMLAPIDVLSHVFDESIKNIEVRDNVKVEEKELNLNDFKIEDFKLKCYEYTYYENNEKVYSISCGIMVTGYLLIINLYSALKEEVENAIKYIYSIEKIN
ncbi:hypothetical protein OCK72_00110 [Fusobacterium simiae]|uniref:Uncharacterized protein n=1 Tax=Fusobacterium simiae TaxID=855 RepID=A0ABT4DEM7_FUSSI|nr:hypothetical protein [Fusobacterium simiae]MCY7007047.1 hypothetical protein [Fusobacterium simiae]